jgi:hypothetical protein
MASSEDISGAEVMEALHVETDGSRVSMKDFELLKVLGTGGNETIYFIQSGH